MRTLLAFLGLCLALDLLCESSLAQEAPISQIGPMARPGVSGALPDVLMMDPTSPFPDGISPKKANDYIDRVPVEGRRTRGAREVAIYKAISPSVVLVVTDKAFGSGSIIAGGYVLTNWHVVGDFKQVGVIYKPDGQGSQPSKANMIAAQVVRTDQTRDLALLKPVSIPAGIRPIDLGDRNDFSVGSDVHAIGHPSGEAWSYTKGIISQVRDNYVWNVEPKLSFKADVIQTQTPISPGSSGGPLLSDDGKLIGVNSFKDLKAEAINFAVSVVDVRSFLTATNNVAAASPLTSECKGKVLFDGRDAKNTGSMRTVSLKCNQTADLVFFLPDDKTKPMVAFYDSKGRNKPDAMIFDDSRAGKWQYSYWDVDLDDTFPLRGIHINGELAPKEFEKRCKGKAAPNFRCL
jgi:S1-C subfamily serine protease